MVENTVGKGKMVHYDPFLLIPLCFQNNCISKMKKEGPVWERFKYFFSFVEEYNYNGNESEGSDDEDPNALSAKTLNDPAWKRVCYNNSCLMSMQCFGGISWFSAHCIALTHYQTTKFWI